MSWTLSNFSQNLWKKYGFQANPFDTTPLNQGEDSLLPISEALVGRGLDTKESKSLINILRNPGGARVIIDGNSGVGKTTFVNYHRYLWENHAQDILFTTQDEIAITESWRLHHFLINILSALLTKLIILLGKKKVTKIAVCKEILALSQVLYQTGFNVEGSILGSGGGFGKSQHVNVPVIPEVQLIYYFKTMVQEIKKMGYAGIFLHIDNLELFYTTNSKKAQVFFNEIRDAIQIPDVYFIFVGSKGFFQEIISPLERVRSIFFGRPVVIPPLSKEQVLEAIKRRYELLKATNNFTIPVEYGFIDYLYDLYEGKLRYIMDAMNMILPEFDSGTPYTISSKEAQNCLSHLVEENIKENLTPNEWKVFKFCIGKNDFTNTEISTHFGFPAPNVSRIMQRFLALSLVSLKKREGRYSYYQVSEYTRIINKVANKTTCIEPIKSIKLSASARLKRALEIIDQRKTIRHKEYVKLLNISPATATRDLNKLVKIGKIKSVGKGKGKFYILSSNNSMHTDSKTRR